MRETTPNPPLWGLRNDFICLLWKFYVFTTWMSMWWVVNVFLTIYLGLLKKDKVGGYLRPLRLWAWSKLCEGLKFQSWSLKQRQSVCVCVLANWNNHMSHSENLKALIIYVRNLTTQIFFVSVAIMFEIIMYHDHFPRLTIVWPLLCYVLGIVPWSSFCCGRCATLDV